MTSDFPWLMLAAFAAGLLLVGSLVVAFGGDLPGSFRAP